ncbi:MAG: DUF1598 domain-containing protein [Planctomycetota bacterium]
MSAQFYCGRQNYRWRRSLAALLAAFAVWLSPVPSAAQPPAGLDGGNAPPGNANVGVGNVGGGNIGGGFPGGGLFGGGEGAAANADFDSLIDLIVSTVEHDSWMENGTGEGEIQPFPNGVWADAVAAVTVAAASSVESPEYRAPEASAAPADPEQPSTRRFVSLPRLEAEIIRRQAAGEPLDETMLALAGLERIDFVLVDQAGRDLVLVGPAGAWAANGEAQIVSVQTGRPIVRLDDLLAMWRHGATDPKPFGCSINPRQEGLQRVQQYVAASSAAPLEPGERPRWVAGLQDSLGKQDTEFFGVDANARVARVLLAADYHMKLVGMGLVDGVEGVESYLESVEVDAAGNVPPMTVLRWWFALEPAEISSDAARAVFTMPHGVVSVLSENELLAARGQRVHTGKSDELNRRFAASFTRSFAKIAEKYPLYRELEQLFELSLAVELIRREGLTERAGWLPTVFSTEPLLRLPKARVPTELESVINHRVVRQRHIVAGVSGGVWADAVKSLRVSVGESSEPAVRMEGRPHAPGVWWWD